MKRPATQFRSRDVVRLTAIKADENNDPDHAFSDSSCPYIQFNTNGDVRRSIGGTIILASWPYAYLVMMPVNVWLFVIPPGIALSGLRKLMRDRGLLEWGHVLIGCLELPL
jgi:hypothetical protein